MPGARCARRCVCEGSGRRHTRQSGHTGITRHSPRSGLRLIRDLPGEPCTFATVIRAALSCELDTSLWGVGTTRFRHPLQALWSGAPSASTASPSHIGDLAQRPLDGTGWRKYSSIIISVKQKYFFARGLTPLPINRSDLPVGRDLLNRLNKSPLSRRLARQKNLCPMPLDTR